jgi:aspartate-semialdehyde dehydrogenase
MTERPLSIALVGASTLAGKALSESLSLSAFAAADLRLIDDEAAQGKLASVAGEAAVIQGIGPNSFEGCDFTFFAGSRDLAEKHWRQALDAGSRIVDLTGELESAPGTPIRAPWIQDSLATECKSGTVADAASQPEKPDLQTRTVVSAHPAAALLAWLALRSCQAGHLHALWATLLQPASELGQPALEELQHQTTNLLSFQPLPTDVFGVQAAFTLAVSSGVGNHASPEVAGKTIGRHLRAIAPQAADISAVQAIQVPVFHGYGLSVAVEFEEPVSASVLEKALSGAHVQVVPGLSGFPGSAEAANEERMQILVRPIEDSTPARQRPGHVEGKDPTAFDLASSESKNGPLSRRFWVWAVADNLAFAAKNAVACAIELDRLRPRGSVQ